MRQTKEKATICGRKCVYSTHVGFNTIWVEFFFDHKVSEELSFEFWTFFKEDCYVFQHNNYDKVTIRLDSRPFNTTSQAVEEAKTYFKGITWMPVHTTWCTNKKAKASFWSTLNRWFNEHGVVDKTSDSDLLLLQQLYDEIAGRIIHVR